MRTSTTSKKRTLASSRSWVWRCCPSRLKNELTALAEAIVAGADIAADTVLAKHAPWVTELKQQYTFTAENALDIVLRETGKVFSAVLEDAGVYKNTAEGKAAFLRFVEQVNQD